MAFDLEHPAPARFCRVRCGPFRAAGSSDAPGGPSPVLEGISRGVTADDIDGAGLVELNISRPPSMRGIAIGVRMSLARSITQMTSSAENMALQHAASQRGVEVEID